MRKYIINALVLALVAVAIYYFFNGINVENFWAEAQKLKLEVILFTMFLSLSSHWLRAYRWNITLQAIGYSPGVLRSFQSLMNGYLSNLIFPRLGEVIRCTLLERSDKVPTAVGVGSVVGERVIDLLMLLICLLGASLYEADFILGKLENAGDRTLLLAALGGIALLGLGALFLIYRYVSKTPDEKRPTWLKKVMGLFQNFKEGLLSVGKVKNPFAYIASTLGIWVLYYFMTYLIVFASVETEHLPVLTGFVFLGVGALAMVVPVQGGIGAYHVLMAATFVHFGTSDVTGLLMATTLHTAQTVLVIVVGLVTLAFQLNAKRRDSKV